MEGPLLRLLISSWFAIKHGRHRQFLFLIGRFLKIFSYETSEWRTMFSQIQSKLEILSTRGWFLQEWFKQDRVGLWMEGQGGNYRMRYWQDRECLMNANHRIQMNYDMLLFIFYVRRMGTLNPRSRVQELPHVHVKDPSYRVR